MKSVVLNNKVACKESGKGIRAFLAGVWSDGFEMNLKSWNVAGHATWIKKYSGRDIPIGIEISRAKTGKLVRKKCQ
jgi:hypothetical protein